MGTGRCQMTKPKQYKILARGLSENRFDELVKPSTRESQECALVNKVGNSNGIGFFACALFSGDTIREASSNSVT